MTLVIQMFRQFRNHVRSSQVSKKVRRQDSKGSGKNDDANSARCNSFGLNASLYQAERLSCTTI